MTRKIAFLLLVSVFLNVFPCYAEETSNERTKDTPGTAIFVMAVPMKLQVEEQNHVQEDEKWHSQISYPAISGLADKKAEKKINAVLKEHGTTLQKKFVKEAKYNTSKVKYELISQYTVQETKSPYFLVTFFDYLYQGGSHGIPSYQYVTLNLQNDTILTLDQLFSQEAEYKEALQSLLIKQIEKRTDAKALLQDEIYAHLQIQENQNFYIKPNGDLVLVFNLNEVIPVTTGFMEFTLTTKMLDEVALSYQF
ncbi:MAG: DUF4163 domain-containing protein [Niameybacter sp.]|uniref:DUF3298 and DUF4163 domain-containing protein n=2 Tax=Niameybacter sp. TaxID=2033640 RepID=UPI002FCA136E